MQRRIVLALLAVLALVPFHSLSATQLGDQAPALDIANWIKGDAVELGAGKGSEIYVVEFWATWCGPCRTSIPHLTEMQQKFKDKGVTIIGISAESAATIEPFVKKMGKKMDYSVAADRNRKTNAAYMQAFGVNGIPHAFVIGKQGDIVWHGHPMSGLDKVLDQVVAGNYDASTAIGLAKAEALLPEFGQLIMDGSDNARADELCEKIIEYGSVSPNLLNRVAWVLLTEEKLKYKNNELAMKAVKIAYDATEGQDSSITETYARGFYETGNLEKAIEYQALALAANKKAERNGRYQSTLDQYKKEAAGN